MKKAQTEVTSGGGFVIIGLLLVLALIAIALLIISRLLGVVKF